MGLVLSVAFVRQMLQSCTNRPAATQTPSIASARRHLHKLTPRVISVGFGGHGDVLPKQRREVTVVRAPDLRSDVDEWYVGLDQQPLRLLHPARNHVLVGRLPGGALEQARKVARARLRHGGKLDQG